MVTRRQVFARFPRPHTKAGLWVSVAVGALVLLVVGSATAVTISHGHHSQVPTATLVTGSETDASDSAPTGSDETTTQAETDGRSIVEEASPALEADHEDHDSYVGMTVAKLHADYDLTNTDITVVYTRAEAYCIASTGTDPVYYEAGPFGTPTTTACSADAAASAGASIVKRSVPAIEAYYMDHNSYVGMTAAKLRSDYDSAIANITVVYAHADSYCIASVGTDPTYYDTGPSGAATPFGKPTTKPCSADAASSR